jgi:hypothetical protein
MRARAWLVVPALALALAPALAHAQIEIVNSTLSVSVDDPGRALQPGKNETFDVRVTYSPQAGAQPGPGTDPDPTSENGTKRTKVSFAVKTSPSWLSNATFDPPALEFAVQTGGGGVTRFAKLTVHVAAKAPALQKELLVITASAEPNGNVKGAAQDSPEIKVKPAFVPKINITAPPSMFVPGGRWTDMPFTMKNLGNGETKVKLNVTARPQDSQVDYPQTMTVPLDGTVTAIVRLRIPWTYGESGALELEALPLTEDDTGRPAHVGIEVDGESAVPDVGAPLLLALVAALAWGARGRRNL